MKKINPTNQKKNTHTHKRFKSNSKVRLHDRFSGDPLYTSIAIQPMVSAATTISHTNTQRPYQKNHSCVIQCCCARLHVVTLCASCSCRLNRPTMVPSDRIARRTMTSLLFLSSSSIVSLFSQMKTNIRQSYAAVFETEQSPPMISISSACEVTFQMEMRLFTSDRPFSCPAEVSISHTTFSV